MPYKNVKPEDTAKVDQCVKELLADPNFKPQTKGQTKESAAFAVCISKYQAMAKPSFQVLVDKPQDVLAADNRIYTIFPEGDYSESEQFPGFVADAKYLRSMVKNMHAGVVPEVPVDIDHPQPGDATAAAGWVKLATAQYVPGVGIQAEIDWTELGKKLVGGRIYRGFSPEWFDEYMDDENRTEHGPTLYAVTLTNRRFFRSGIPAIAAKRAGKLANKLKAGILYVPISKQPLMAQDQKTFVKDAAMSEDMEMPGGMDLASISAKKLEDITPEELAFMAEHWAEMTPEMQEKFKPLMEEYAKKQEAAKLEIEAKPKKAPAKAEATPKTKPEVAPVVEKPAEAEVKPEPKIEVVPEAKTATKSLETQKAVDNSMNETLKAALDRANKAELELKKTKVAAWIDQNAMIGVAGGKLTGAGREAAITLMLKDETSFKAMLAAMPGVKIPGKLGSSSRTPLNKVDAVNRIMKDEMSKNPNLGHDRAWAIAIERMKDVK